MKISLLFLALSPCLCLTLPAPLRLRFACCFVVWSLKETFPLDMYLCSMKCGECHLSWVWLHVLCFSCSRELFLLALLRRRLRLPLRLSWDLAAVSVSCCGFRCNAAASAGCAVAVAALWALSSGWIWHNWHFVSFEHRFYIHDYNGVCVCVSVLLGKMLLLLYCLVGSTWRGYCRCCCLVNMFTHRHTHRHALMSACMCLCDAEDCLRLTGL